MVERERDQSTEDRVETAASDEGQPRQTAHGTGSLGAPPDDVGRGALPDTGTEREGIAEADLGGIGLGDKHGPGAGLGGTRGGGIGSGRGSER